MTEISITPTQIMAAVGVLLVLVLVWRSGARRARAAADAARTGARLVSLAGRVLTSAALIVIVQWAVVAYRGPSWRLLAALGLPALFSASALTHALPVTTYDAPRRGGVGPR